MANIINVSNSDDDKTIISLNPSYSKQENIDYETKGKVPIIGIAKTANGVLTPDKLQMVVDNMEANTGKESAKLMDKRSKQLGYRQEEFDFIHDPEVGLMKDPTKTNTAVIVDNIKIEAEDKSDDESDEDIMNENVYFGEERLKDFCLRGATYLKEDDKYIYYKSKRGNIRRRRKDKVTNRMRTKNLEEFVLQLSDRLDILMNALNEQTNYLTKLNIEISNIRDYIG